MKNAVRELRVGMGLTQGQPGQAIPLARHFGRPVEEVFDGTSMGRRPAPAGSRWYLPGVARAIGIAYLLPQGFGGDWGGGAIAFGIMAALALVFLFGARWDAIRQLRADTQDERGAAIGGVGYVAALVVLRRRS